MKRAIQSISRWVHTLWPFGLFLFYVLVVLSFQAVDPAALAQLFGLAVVLSGAVAWLIFDYTRDSDNRVRSRLEELEDFLAPYDGMKLKEMPPEVQAEVRRRLGWGDAAISPAAKPAQK